MQLRRADPVDGLEVEAESLCGMFAKCQHAVQLATIRDETPEPEQCLLVQVTLNILFANRTINFLVFFVEYNRARAYVSSTGIAQGQDGACALKMQSIAGRFFYGRRGSLVRWVGRY